MNNVIRFVLEAPCRMPAARELRFNPAGASEQGN
jgi:hypothetical protein